MADLFETIYSEVSELLAPLLDPGSDLSELFGRLGLDLGAADVDLDALETAIGDLGTQASRLSTLAPPASVLDLAPALDDVAQTIAAVHDLLAALDGLAGLDTELRAAIASVRPRLFDLLLLYWLRDRHSLLYSILDLLGALRDGSPDGAPVILGASGDRLAYLPAPSRTLDGKMILAALRDPLATLRERYLPSGETGEAAVAALVAEAWPRIGALGLEWGAGVVTGTNAEFRGAVGGTNLELDRLAEAALIVPLLPPGATSAGAQLALTLVPPPTAGGRTSVVAELHGALDEELAVGAWQLLLHADATASAVVDTAGSVSFPTSSTSGDALTLALTATRSPQTGGADSSPAAPALLVGAEKGSRVEIACLAASMRATLAAGKAADIGIEVQAGGIALVLDLSDGDGFLQHLARVVANGPIRAQADVTLGWSRTRDLYLAAGGHADTSGSGLGARLPLNLHLGPVAIPAVRVAWIPAAADATNPERLQIRFGLEAQLALGPIGFVVTGPGIELDLAARTDSHGSIGPFDLTVRLAPPTGIGLSVSAPAVAGTGFLDASRPGEYLGAVSLNVGAVSIAGVGALTTQTKSAPFSLIVLANVGLPPIQLGFGFALTGLGILVGVNRTMDVAALRDLARSGGLDTVMFPTDMAHNAPRVAADLDRIFPPAEGQFVVGPSARVTWGTGGILTAQLGILIELPTLRAAVLGALRMTLPDAHAPVADLHLDVIGIIDLPQRLLSIDASLHDSRIAGMPLSGQAALRLGWGATPMFILSVGGFNPHYPSPASFPKLARVTLALATDNPRLRLSAYLALTSNTVQLGATADLFVSAGPASLAAGATFDALVQFRPFRLEIDLTIYASLMFEGTPIVSVTLAVHLSGPSPWHLAGKASFALLSFSFTIPFQVTIGAAEPSDEVVAVDIGKLLAEAVSKVDAISSEPASAPAVVQVRAAGTPPPVHPLGTLKVRQHVVPLEQTITRFGSDHVSPQIFQLTAESGETSGANPATDYFGRAQFFDLDDAAKLTAPSFELFAAGLQIGSGSLVLPNKGGSSVMSVSTKDWQATVLGPPGKSGTTTTSHPDAIEVPASVIDAQLPKAASAVNGSAGRASRAYPGAREFLRPVLPQFAVTSPGLAAPADNAMLGISSSVSAHAIAESQTVVSAPSGTTPAIVLDRVVYRSELVGAASAVLA